jgi:RNA polymerase sigma factor (sigma-70 family)
MEVRSQREVTSETAGRSHRMESDSEADLVAWMTLREEDEEVAFEACAVLYRRHGPVLLGWCQQKMGDIFGAAAEDFVNATFLKAFDYAETFKCPSGTPPEEQKKRVVGWLFTILENLLKDSFKAEARERKFRNRDVDVAELGYDEPFDFPTQSNTDEQPQPSRRAILTAKFLEEEVSDDDAQLLQLSANFFDFARNEPAIDPDLLNGICERMGLTPSGLRSRRKRISARLRQYIEHGLD